MAGVGSRSRRREPIERVESVGGRRLEALTVLAHRLRPFQRADAAESDIERGRGRGERLDQPGRPGWMEPALRPGEGIQGPQQLAQERGGGVGQLVVGLGHPGGAVQVDDDPILSGRHHTATQDRRFVA